MKAGFVNIIGKPNAGKSTLMNQLVGERLAIITPKVQTTRHRITGIVNGDDYQIVYSDTPGIIEKPGYQMQEAMMRFVETSLEDADILLILIEVADTDVSLLQQKIQNISTPIVLLVNKIDTITTDMLLPKLQYWQQQFPNAQHIVPISALEGKNIKHLESLIISMLPEHPAYFDAEELTDRPERFFIGEIIREKIFLIYRQEIPYSVEVTVEEFKELPSITRIKATIFCNRASQKSIIIGEKGKMLNKVGTLARMDIEKWLQAKVFLDLYVKVREDWRNDRSFLDYRGYE